MTAQFPFPLITGAFQSLLSHPWAVSADTGHTRTAQSNLSDFELGFMEKANKYFGYTFHTRTSPTLGKTIGLHPEGNNANKAFINAEGQVSDNGHTSDAAAKGLAIHAFFQQHYQNANVLKTWGQWELGFNPSRFSVFKRPRNDNENLFLMYAANLVNQADHQMQERSTAHGRTYAAGTIDYMTFDVQSHTPQILTMLQDKIVSGLDICGTAKPYELMAISKKLGF